MFEQPDASASKPNETCARAPRAWLPLLVGSFVFAALVAAAYWVYVQVVIVPRMMNNFGCVWLTHDVLQGYLIEHPGMWPSGWDDLAPHFDEVSNGGYGYSVEFVKERVRINFQIVPAEFTARRRGGDPAPLRAIELVDGMKLTAVVEANERLEHRLLSPTRFEAVSQPPLRVSAP